MHFEEIAYNFHLAAMAMRILNGLGFALAILEFSNFGRGPHKEHSYEVLSLTHCFKRRCILKKLLMTYDIRHTAEDTQTPDAGHSLITIAHLDHVKKSTSFYICIIIFRNNAYKMFMGKVICLEKKFMGKVNCFSGGATMCVPPSPLLINLCPLSFCSA